MSPSFIAWWHGSTSWFWIWIWSRTRQDYSENRGAGFLARFCFDLEDLSDYALEIEYFDWPVGKILAFLESKHQLDHTLIIATTACLFLRAKVNAYEYGAMYPWHSGEEIRLLQDKSIIHSWASAILRLRSWKLLELGESIEWWDKVYFSLLNPDVFSSTYHKKDCVVFG